MSPIEPPPALTMCVPIEWKDGLRACGPDDKPWAKLLGWLTIAGVDHHIEAFAVEWVRDGMGVRQEAVAPEHCNFDELSEIAQGAMQTVDIGGRPYVFLVTPFQE